MSFSFKCAQTIQTLSLEQMYTFYKKYIFLFVSWSLFTARYISRILEKSLVKRLFQQFSWERLIFDNCVSWKYEFIIFSQLRISRSHRTYKFERDQYDTRRRGYIHVSLWIRAYRRYIEACLSVKRSLVW